MMALNHSGSSSSSSSSSSQSSSPSLTTTSTSSSHHQQQQQLTANSLLNSSSSQQANHHSSALGNYQQSGQQGQPPNSSNTGGNSSGQQQSGITSNRSRRGRPPSIPDEHNLARSMSSGRTDKAHHKCPHCPQIYYGYHAMRDHITSVHLNSGEKYICHLCNKEYTWRITLRKHLKCQHGVHPDQVQTS